MARSSGFVSFSGTSGLLSVSGCILWHMNKNFPLHPFAQDSSIDVSLFLLMLVKKCYTMIVLGIFTCFLPVALFHVYFASKFT